MKEKLNFELVHLSLIAIVLGWLLYLMMALITGSFIFWQIRSTWLYREFKDF